MEDHPTCQNSPGWGPVLDKWLISYGIILQVQWWIWFCGDGFKPTERNHSKLCVCMYIYIIRYIYVSMYKIYIYILYPLQTYTWYTCCSCSHMFLNWHESWTSTTFSSYPIHIPLNKNPVVVLLISQSIVLLLNIGGYFSSHQLHPLFYFYIYIYYVY